MADIIISTPTGVFEVEIKDSDGNTVYGPTMQSNAPFDPGITTPGDYIVYVTFDGNTNGWCWHISSCLCPVPTDAVIFDESGMRYIEFTFDIPDVEEFCMFTISLDYGDGGGGVVYPVHITDISQLTFVSGTTYTKKIALTYAPLTTSVTYRTYQLLPPADFTLTPCMNNPATVVFEDAPCIEPVSSKATWRLVEDAGDYYIEIGFQTNCDTENCDSFTLNYLQTNTVPSPTGPYDSGSYTFTADCSDYPAVTYMRFLINPQLGAFATSAFKPMVYNVTLIGCCNGDVVESATISCKNQQFASVGLVKIGSDYFIRVSVDDCGGVCHSFGATSSNWLQLGTFGSGIADSATMPSTAIDCDAAFPQTFDFLVNPNLTVVGGLIQYKVLILSCCGQGQTFVTNTLPV